jgi:hypothetical protein
MSCRYNCGTQCNELDGGLFAGAAGAVWCHMPICTASASSQPCCLATAMTHLCIWSAFCRPLRRGHLWRLVRRITVQMRVALLLRSHQTLTSQSVAGYRVTCAHPRTLHKESSNNLISVSFHFVRSTPFPLLLPIQMPKDAPPSSRLPHTSVPMLCTCSIPLRL